MGEACENVGGAWEKGRGGGEGGPRSGGEDA